MRSRLDRESTATIIKQMNHTQSLLSSLDALFTVTTKQADRHGLDEIRISKARAKELLHDIILARKSTERPSKPLVGEQRLNHIFGV